MPVHDRCDFMLDLSPAYSLIQTRHQTTRASAQRLFDNCREVRYRLFRMPLSVVRHTAVTARQRYSGGRPASGDARPLFKKKKTTSTPNFLGLSQGFVSSTTSLGDLA